MLVGFTPTGSGGAEGPPTGLGGGEGPQPSAAAAGSGQTPPLMPCWILPEGLWVIQRCGNSALVVSVQIVGTD